MLVAGNITTSLQNWENPLHPPNTPPLQAESLIAFPNAYPHRTFLNTTSLCLLDDRHVVCCAELRSNESGLSCPSSMYLTCVDVLGRRVVDSPWLDFPRFKTSPENQFVIPNAPAGICRPNSMHSDSSEMSFVVFSSQSLSYFDVGTSYGEEEERKGRIPWLLGSPRHIRLSCEELDGLNSPVVNLGTLLPLQDRFFGILGGMCSHIAFFDCNRGTATRSQALARPLEARCAVHADPITGMVFVAGDGEYVEVFAEKADSDDLTVSIRTTGSGGAYSIRSNGNELYVGHDNASGSQPIQYPKSTVSVWDMRKLDIPICLISLSTVTGFLLGMERVQEDVWAVASDDGDIGFFNPRKMKPHSNCELLFDSSSVDWMSYSSLCWVGKRPWEGTESDGVGFSDEIIAFVLEKQSLAKVRIVGVGAQEIWCPVSVLTV